MSRAVPILLALLLGSISRLQQVNSEAATLSPTFHGEACPFGGTEEGLPAGEPSGPLLLGSCGYGAIAASTWPYWSIATVSVHNPALLNNGSGICGACLEVSCVGSALCASARPNGQQAVVFVADVSETFSPAQLSIQASYAQAAIGDAGNTSLPVTFRQVECEPPGGVVVRVDRYTVSGGGSVSLVPMQGVSDYARMWRPMHNTQGAAWALSDLLPPPFDLRLTDTLGRSTVADRAIPAPAGGDYATDAQFSTADRPGRSDEVAQGTPLDAPQQPSPPRASLPPSISQGGVPADPYAYLTFPPPAPLRPPAPAGESIFAAPLQDFLTPAPSPAAPPAIDRAPPKSPGSLAELIAVGTISAVPPAAAPAAAQTSFLTASPVPRAPAAPPPSSAVSLDGPSGSTGPSPALSHAPGPDWIVQLSLDALLTSPVASEAPPGPPPVQSMAARDGAQPQQQQGCVSSPYDYLQPQPEFSTFLRNANQLGLAPLLQNNSTALTVFAPSNGAWVHLPPGLVLNDSRALGNIMLYHIALGDRTQASLAEAPGFQAQQVQEAAGPQGFVPIDTLEGAPLYARGTAGGQLLLQQNGSLAASQTTTLAQATCNGMVYGLSAILAPSPYS